MENAVNLLNLKILILKYEIFYFNNYNAFNATHRDVGMCNA